MEYRNLGDSGLRVSVVGLGCNNFGMRTDEQTSADVIHSALDCGINFLDTAELYGKGLSEEYIGKALQGDRHRAIIATKFGYTTGASRRQIMDSAQNSLRRLQTDYIDLYYIHRPDPTTPIEETLRALDDLVRAGHVRYIGCSNFSGWQLADAHWTARTEHLNRFICVQNEYNILKREIEREVAPACEKFGVGIVPWSPLANGLLTGKYRPGEEPPAGTRLATSPAAGQFLTEDNFSIVARLEAVAAARGHTIGELAIAWLASQARVSSVIAGATRPEQVEANAKAAEWKMTAEDLEAVESALQG